MNIEQFEPHIVVNEWQLGQQLNSAVHTGARDKFNLLLSFLSDDANEALLSKKEAGVLPDDILDNLPLLKQQRIHRAYQANLPEVLDDKTIATGVDINLLDEYKKLDLANRPLKVHYY